MRADKLGHHENLIYFERLRDSVVDGCSCSITAVG